MTFRAQVDTCLIVHLIFENLGNWDWLVIQHVTDHWLTIGPMNEGCKQLLTQPGSVHLRHQLLPGASLPVAKRSLEVLLPVERVTSSSNPIGNPVGNPDGNMKISGETERLSRLCKLCDLLYTLRFTCWIHLHYR